MTNPKPMKAMRVHEHGFTRGPRSHRSGNWPEGMGGTLIHSHEDGTVPHSHPDTGPADMGFGKAKFTARPNGEQFEFVGIDPASLKFDLFILDSAVPMGDQPPGNHGDSFLMPAAERMTRAFGLTAVVHDLRTRAAIRGGGR